jgi:hypothetical protein
MFAVRAVTAAFVAIAVLTTPSAIVTLPTAATISVFATTTAAISALAAAATTPIGVTAAAATAPRGVSATAATDKRNDVGSGIAFQHR